MVNLGWNRSASFLFYILFQPYSKIDWIRFFLELLHKKTHNDNIERFFLGFCKFIKNTNMEITCKQVFTAFSMTLKIKLRFILVPLNIAEMFVQLSRSLPVVNSSDCTLSGKAQVWLGSQMHTSEHK